MSTKLDKTKYTNNPDGVLDKYGAAAYMKKEQLQGQPNSYY